MKMNNIVKGILIILISGGLLMGYETVQSDKYRVGFCDSGIGGLLFAVDNYEVSEAQLKNIEKNYRVSIEYVHVGDSKNAPYGLKARPELVVLTQKLVGMVTSLKPDMVFVACNTASTVFDKSFQADISKKYPETPVLPIIMESAKELYKSGKVVTNPKTGEKELHLVVLATVGTIKNGNYQKALQEIHDQNLGKDGVKLFVDVYAPKNWAGMIEANGRTPELEATVAQDLKALSERYPALDQASAVGLFCTHFPLVKEDVAAFFKTQFKTSPVLVSQGSLFSDDVLNDINAKIKSGKIKKRILPTPFAKAIPIDVYVTGDNLETMKATIGKVSPAIAKHMVFHQL